MMDAASVSFRPVLVVPVYNHHLKLPGMIAAAQDRGLPCILVNDGSNDETRAALHALRADEVTVVDLPVNGGKGAAVMAGLAEASERGYSHAVQIDADGQHEIAEVSKFLDTAREAPGAMVLGTPVYDKSVPTYRYLLRYLTHACVHLETLSFAIKDSMCGYRVYPLSRCMALFKETSLGKRMDFDVEIAVRMCWTGVEVRNVPTPVIYGDDEPSHFRLVRDNILITWLHIRLIVGMLFRFPGWVWRRGWPRTGSAAWDATQERGSRRALKFFVWLYRLLGRRVCHWIVYPVIGYFFLTSRKARRYSRAYLQRVYETGARRVALGAAPGGRATFRHLLAFGRSFVDKFGSWMGDFPADDLDWDSRELFDAMIADGQGAVVMSGHLGNLEVLRAACDVVPGITVNHLAFTDHAEKFVELLNEVNPNVSVNMLSTSSVSPDFAVMLRERVARGELVAVMGDRAIGGPGARTVEVEFLGETARFPQGPFILAGLLDCPVYLIFCLRDTQGRYKIYLEKFSDSLKLPRKDRREGLQRIVASFASRLEHYCCLAPFQWTNFYDFWDEDRPALNAPAPAPAPAPAHVPAPAPSNVNVRTQE